MKQPFEKVVARYGATVLRVCQVVLGPADVDGAACDCDARDAPPLSLSADNSTVTRQPSIRLEAIGTCPRLGSRGDHQLRQRIGGAPAQPAPFTSTTVETLWR